MKVAVEVAEMHGASPEFLAVVAGICLEEDGASLEATVVSLELLP